MASRYTSAHREIRAILQREPHLTAKQLWHELTCWPVPSERTIHRFAQEAKLDLAVGTDMAANTRNRKAVSATVERTDDFLKEFYMATADEKLDQIAAHLESLHTKHDAMRATCDSLVTRVDALEGEREKQKADAEREEKEKADAVKGAGAPRADATAESRNAFSSAQLRLDSATQAWGHQARPPLAGESLRDYRISVLNGLKQHSRAYKDSDLSTIGDENVFTNIEGMIINDAIEASNVSIVPGAPLTKRTRVNEHGQRITTFQGDAGLAWAPFMGGGTQFGKINSNPNR
jgi:hypothetical protein